MTLHQRKAFADLNLKILELDSCVSHLRRQLRRLPYYFDTEEDSHNEELNLEEINDLLKLNQQLMELELYLCEVGNTESAYLDARVGDPNDPLDDYEIDATISFTLGEDDPVFVDTDDNFLTQRNFSLKHLDNKNGLRDGFDYRETVIQFPGELNNVPHCWLFHDLYDHSYGVMQPALNLQDCLRVDSIWVDIAVRHQSTLDIKSCKWRQPL